MQLVTNLSKYLLSAVLICSLMLAWNDGNIEITNISYNDTESSASRNSALRANSIWASMSSELKLDHKVQSARVQAEIRKLLADRGKFVSILEAAGPYIHFIYQQTKAYGLPAEIALIPVIESEYNPNDKSHKGATGLWQLMPGTARELGVKVKSGYDGRRNVLASTKAALAYFNDLGNLFKGNWYLAIAAYNCGQGRVASAIRRNGSQSFWNLSLPQETKLYVPKLLAVAAILKDPEKYGIKLPHVTNQPYFSELTVNKPVNLTNVAKSSGINTATLHKLNPDYKNGPALPKKNGSYSILVPTEKVPAVKAKLADKVITVAESTEIKLRKHPI